MSTNKERGFFDYLLLFWNRKWFILINFIIVSSVAVVISLSLTKQYKGNATILPSESKQIGGLSGLFQSLPAGLHGLTDEFSGQASNYLAILNSRTIKEIIIKKYSLMQRYESEDIEKALEKLSGRMEVTLNDDGSISLSVYDEDPKYAADITNFYVHLLDSLNRHLNTKSARAYRKFIEERYQKNLKELKQSEEYFKKIQQTTGILDIEEQVRASITQYVELETALLQLRIEKAGLESQVSKSNPQLQEINQSIEYLKKEKHQLASTDTSLVSGLFPSLENAPELGLKYLRAKRDVEIQQRIQEFMLPRYEEAKLEEMRNTPTIQVIDSARVPLEEAKPSEMLIVLSASMFSLVFSLLFILIQESVREYRNREQIVQE